MRILLLLLTFFGVSAQAMSASDVPSLAAQYANLLRPYTYVLDRDLIVFHYASRHANQPKLTLADAQKILPSGQFFDSKTQGNDLMGPGLYTSIDAYATRSYGGAENPALYVLKIKKGTRLLGALERSLPQVTRQLYQLFKQVGCSDKTYGLADYLTSGDIVDLVGRMRESDTFECRRALVESFRQLGIQAIEYGYEATSGLADCRYYRDSAINIVSASAVEKESVALITDEQTVNAEKVLPFVTANYVEGERIRLRFYGPPSSDVQDLTRPKMLNAAIPSHADYKAWKTAYIYSCGPVRAGENLLVEKWNGAQWATYGDAEVSLIFQRVQKLYLIKAMQAQAAGGTMSSNFKASKTRLVVDSVFKASGLPDSARADWNKAKDAMSEPNQTPLERIHAAENLLHEPYRVPTINFGDNELNVRLMIQLLDRGESLYQANAELYARVGMGPILTQIDTYANPSFYGGALPVSAEAARDVLHADRALQARNREAYRQFIMKCEALYLSQATPASVQASPYGITN